MARNRLQTGDGQSDGPQLPVQLVVLFATHFMANMLSSVREAPGADKRSAVEDVGNWTWLRYVIRSGTLLPHLAGILPKCGYGKYHGRSKVCIG